MESISFSVINNSLTSLIAQLVLTIQIRLVKNFPKLEKKTNKKTESVQEEDKVELQLVFCLKTPKNKATKSLMIYSDRIRQMRIKCDCFRLSHSFKSLSSESCVAL